MLAVPAKHKLAARKSITYADILQEELLLLEDGHCLREQALEVCMLTGMKERANFRATSLETLRQMVVAGVGVTLIPSIAKQENDGLVYIPFRNHHPARTIGLVWRKTSPRKPCIEGIIQKLIAYKTDR
jgi:LysR family transcriptional regulator, hydrogen peroxide-inducible genes activator